MKTLTVIIWSVVVLLALLFLCAVVIWLEKRFPGEAYDERQKIARSRGYRISFWIGNIYYLGVMAYLINQVGKNAVLIEPFILLLIGFALQALVLHCYCLLTHAALPIGEKPYITIICYLFMAFINLVSSRQGLLPEEVSFIGQESAAALRLIMVICFTALAVMHIIRLLIREKE